MKGTGLPGARSSHMLFRLFEKFLLPLILNEIDERYAHETYRLFWADPVTRNAVSGRRTTSWH